MSPIVLVDTREKVNRHILKRLDELNIEYRLQKLNYGDYSFIWNNIEYSNKIVVERKSNVTELCGNFAKGKSDKGKDTTRLQREFQRAYKGKCKVVLMIEDCSWDKIQNHEYRSKFSPSELKSRINTWCNKFQLELKFTSKDQSADLILQCFRDFIKNERSKNE